LTTQSCHLKWNDTAKNWDDEKEIETPLLSNQEETGSGED
jgi:hypothetical protein